MEFIILATAHFMALITPGPDFFLIMQTALRMRLKYAWAVCAGIATANGVYISIAVLGLEYVRTMHLLMRTLHYAGGMYLLYIGILLLKAPRHTGAINKTTNILRLQNSKKQFLIGLTSGILNPKNIIFYLSLFTAIVSPATPLLQRSLYGLWMAAMVLSLEHDDCPGDQQTKEGRPVRGLALPNGKTCRAGTGLLWNRSFPALTSSLLDRLAKESYPSSKEITNNTSLNKRGVGDEKRQRP